MDLKPGLTGAATTTVSDANTALTVRSGGLPVFATPMMVALMEEAAVNAIADALADGEQSLGVAIDVSHEAPSRKGMKITARAEVVEVSGRKVLFHVEAHDDAGRIGRGRHTRVVVDAQSFVRKADAR